VPLTEIATRDSSFGPSAGSSKGGGRMNRSASMIALTTGFAILGSDLDKKCDAGVQVDEKDEFGCKHCAVTPFCSTWICKGPVLPGPRSHMRKLICTSKR
jgi:hypothetical protein